MKILGDIFLALLPASVLSYIYINNKISAIFGYTISFTYSLSSPAIKELIDTGLYGFAPKEIILFWADAVLIFVVIFAALFFCRNKTYKTVSLRIIILLVLIGLVAATESFSVKIPTLSDFGNDNLINERKITMRNSALPVFPAEPPSAKPINLALIILEAVNAQHFTPTFYPQLHGFITARENYLDRSMISPGGETSIALPRLFHQNINIGTQTFSCADSYLRRLRQKGQHNNFYSAQIYSWLNMESIFSCEPNLNLQIAPTLRKRVKTDQGLAQALSGLNLYELPHGLDDRILAKTIDYDLSHNQLGFPYFLAVHFYGTHFPFVGIPDRPFANYFRTIGSFLQSNQEIKQKLQADLTKQYERALSVNDGNVTSILESIARQAETQAQTVLVVIIADHGEALGEHNYILHAHNSPLYQELINVPLVAFCLGQDNPRCTAVVRALPAQLGNAPYKSTAVALPLLLSVLDNQTPPSLPRAQPIIAQGFRSQALISGYTKTIITPHNQLTFDLLKDPAETTSTHP